MTTNGNPQPVPVLALQVGLLADGRIVLDRAPRSLEEKLAVLGMLSLAMAAWGQIPVQPPAGVMPAPNGWNPPDIITGGKKR